MTVSAADTAGLSGFGCDEPSAVYRAAVSYAEHGWHVLPGSAWNGRRHVIPGTLRVTDGPRPLVARNFASVDVETVTRWWNADTRLDPSVLLRSGAAFNLVSVAFDLAQAVIPVMEAKSQAGPVLYRPDEGRAYFLVQGESELSGQFGKPGEVVAIAPGELVAAPPTNLGNTATVRWWSTPESVSWYPAEVGVLGESLAVACQNREEARSCDER